MQKSTAILACSILAVPVFWFVAGPILQDQAYHGFADSRSIFGIANFWNVVTNLPMMLAALSGLWGLKTKRVAGTKDLQRSLWFFFTGVLLAGAGSTYYHFAPDDASLFWDRLPMTIAFMGLFAALLDVFAGKAAGRFALLPLLATGVASAILWRATGDLRLYVLVQFLPMAIIGLFLLFGLPCRCEKRGIILIFAAYALAKVCESGDQALYALTTVISGHSVKHLFVALAVILVQQAFSPLNFLAGMEPPGVE